MLIHIGIKPPFSLLSALIAYILMTKENATFVDVLKLLAVLKLTIRERLSEHLLIRDLNTLPQKNLDVLPYPAISLFSCLPARTAGCVYGTLNTTLIQFYP